MPKGSEHQSSNFFKSMYIGDGGTGKTGSLISLLRAGYDLKIVDMDNGLDYLMNAARAEQLDLDKIDYETFQDEFRASKNGPLIKGMPKAFVGALEQMTKWSDVEDTNTVFVLDSLTHFGRSAFAWARGMNPTAKDPRNWFHTAQQAVLDTLTLLCGKEFKMNVVVITHINYKELFDGSNKGHPSAIGTAIGPQIPTFFNTLILAESSGSGTNTRRRIKTMPTGVLDLKCANPLVEKEYPLETGLASIFELMKGK